jgi:hypothetical protein
MSLPNYMGCLMEFCKSVSLHYTKMCFKILNFLNKFNQNTMHIEYTSYMLKTGFQEN